jgi:tetratricopeptide (TPR) repeat protein
LSFYGLDQEGTPMTHKLLFVGLLAGMLSFGCTSADQKKSIEKTNEGVKALRSKNYDQAVARLEDATKAYRDNHTAWYNLGLAHDGMKKYDLAATAYEQAAKLSGKDAMYHMQLGIARYNQTVAEQTKAHARDQQKELKDVDPADVDLKGANFEPALTSLKNAVELNDNLFRAHYYIGRIHRHAENARGSADAFTKAIEANPRFVNPYIALGEIYRRWDYTDEAIKVLTQGKANVPGDKERAEMLFALGMAYDDKKDYAKAIEEFTAALAADKNLHKARYQRGLAHFRLGAYKDARADLEQYQKNAKDEFTRSISQKTLMDILAKDG